MKEAVIRRPSYEGNTQKKKARVVSQPIYSKGEELFNAISHIVGGALGILFCVIACLVAAKEPTGYKFTAIAIYSLSIITLYTLSALYHFLPQGRAKRVFRIFDHCTIFLLIAGCYTPFCLILFWQEPIGKLIFVVYPRASSCNFKFLCAINEETAIIPIRF